MTPPLATPSKNTVSANVRKYELSHTKLHSDIHVFPILSFISNSHAVHLVSVVDNVVDVELCTSASLHKCNLFVVGWLVSVKQTKSKQMETAKCSKNCGADKKKENIEEEENGEKTKIKCKFCFP